MTEQAKRTLNGGMMASAEGVDISAYQPVYTVAEMKALAFVFIKATEGTGVTDPNFAANWANAEAAGIPRGAYHFFYPSEDATSQVNHFVSVVKAAGLEDGDMIVVDSETAASNADSATKNFLDGVRAALGDKHPYIVYTMSSVGHTLTETAKAYPLLWFAYPSPDAPSPAQIAPWEAWTFWQWSWSGNLDKDAYNGDEDALAAWLNTFKVTLYKVPDVLGKRAKVAQETLEKAGFVPHLNRSVPHLHTGIVTAQQPKPGWWRAKGTTIDLTLKIEP